jgi:hypothetical protein
MKRIKNLSVYNLLGYLLLAVAAYAFVNANNTDLQATAPVTEETTQSTPNRHTITLVLSQLSDLKVEEGQRINVGDIISDYAVAYAYAIAPPKKPNYKPKNKD